MSNLLKTVLHKLRSSELERLLAESPAKRQFRKIYSTYLGRPRDLELVRNVASFIIEELRYLRSALGRELRDKELVLVAKSWRKFLRELGVDPDSVKRGEFHGLQEQVCKVLRLVFPRAVNISRTSSSKTPRPRRLVIPLRIAFAKTLRCVARPKLCLKTCVAAFLAVLVVVVVLLLSYVASSKSPEVLQKAGSSVSADFSYCAPYEQQGDTAVLNVSCPVSPVVVVSLPHMRKSVLVLSPGESIKIVRIGANKVMLKLSLPVLREILPVGVYELQVYCFDNVMRRCRLAVGLESVSLSCTS